MSIFKLKKQQLKYAIFQFDEIEAERLLDTWEEFAHKKTQHPLMMLVISNLPKITSMYTSGKIDQSMFDSLITPLYKRCGTNAQRASIIGLTTRVCLEQDKPSIFVEMAKLHLSMSPEVKIEKQNIKYSSDLISRHHLFNALFLKEAKLEAKDEDFFAEFKTGLSSLCQMDAHDILTKIELRTIYIEKFLNNVSNIYSTRVITDHFNKYDGSYFHNKLKNAPANEEVNDATRYFLNAHQLRKKWMTLAAPEKVVDLYASWIDFMTAPKWERVCKVHYWDNQAKANDSDIFRPPSFTDIANLQTSSPTLEKINIYLTMGINTDKEIASYLRTSTLQVDNDVELPEVGYGF